MDKVLQQDNAIDLLWDSLKRDPEHEDRRQTGWGTKTQAGLAACVARLGRESAAYQELLAALEQIAAITCDHSPEQPCQRMIAQAAIARAKGGL